MRVVSFPFTPRKPTSLTLSARGFHRHDPREPDPRLPQVFEEAGESDPVFDEYAGLLPKFVADSNVNAQDKGIEACCIFAKRAPVAVVKQTAGTCVLRLPCLSSAHVACLRASFGSHAVCT